MDHYDLICIGCGPAGEKAATQAAYFRRSVAIIEAMPRPGGAMINTGTIPSKVLRETALILSELRRRSIPGVRFEIPHDLSIKSFMARMFAVQQLEHDRVEQSFDRHDIDIIAGRASFLDSNTLFVSTQNGPGRRISADFILIATGSKPSDAATIGFRHPRVVNSNGILELDRIPESLIVIGGGVIATEYACVFAELGVEVTMIEPRESILGFVDPEIRGKLLRHMDQAGIRILTRARVRSVRPPSLHNPDQPVKLELEDGRHLSASHLLYATGRTGCTEHLGLEAIGLQPNHRGYLKVNDHYQTDCPNVYAAGDVVGFPALASTSMEQGRVAACHMFDIDFKKELSPVLPIGLFTIPPIATVGLTEHAAREKGLDVITGRAAMSLTARGRILEADESSSTGLAKIVFEYPSRRIAGVQIFGPEAIELIHIAQMTIRSMTDLSRNDMIDRFVHNVFNYPSLSEVYRLAAMNGLQNIALRENRTDQIAARARVA